MGNKDQFVRFTNMDINQLTLPELRDQLEQKQRQILQLKFEYTEYLENGVASGELTEGRYLEEMNNLVGIQSEEYKVRREINRRWWCDIYGTQQAFDLWKDKRNSASMVIQNVWRNR